ncbi:group II intron maturase-specific domain-containing protein [Nodosilinea sp. P-1105]|uniref:group II intron maturase-specific domain-containing protein n=1 Tax=Nodosilinea sp. P-1105 TaxID=2546229 RepID=UPI0032427CF9
MTRYLTQVLRLKVNSQKSRVRRIERLEYLGFTFQGIRIVWSERAFQDFKHRLRGLTSRRWRVSMEYRLKRISLYLRGWMGYFGISQRYGPIPELDGWLRRRIRMCYWKQWRRPLAQPAEGLDAHWQPAQTGNSETTRLLDGLKPEGVLAVVTDAGDADGDDQ